MTRILEAIRQGDPQAAAQLLPLVYTELRQLAAQQMAREKPGQTLDATALVHEAYLRLVASPQASLPRERGEVHFDNRGHFFAAAAQAMRHILVDNARRKGRLKHGGQRDKAKVDLDGLPAAEPDPDILALHDALEQFAVHGPLKARLVELRFFGGLTLAEAADCMGISLSTADRAWRYARAWLYAAMSNDLSRAAQRSGVSGGVPRIVALRRLLRSAACAARCSSLTCFAPRRRMVR